MLPSKRDRDSTPSSLKIDTVAGRPEPQEAEEGGAAPRGKPKTFFQAAKWTGGFANGDDKTARFRCPGGIAESESGTLFVSDAYNHCIRKKMPDSGSWEVLAGKPGEKGFTDGKEEARFSYPQKIAFDEKSGDVLVADGGSHSIRRVTQEGVVSTLAGKGGDSGHVDGKGEDARFNRPIGIAVDAQGTIYVAEAKNHTIRAISSEGVTKTLAGKAGEEGYVEGKGEEARFNEPCGVAVDKEDGSKLFVADCKNNCIRCISSQGGVVSTVAGSGGSGAGVGDGGKEGEAKVFDAPADVAIGSDGVVVVADTNHHLLRIVSLSTSAVSTLAGTEGEDGWSEAHLFFPQALAVGAGGKILVADTWNHSIRSVSVGREGDKDRKGARARDEEGEDGTGENPAKRAALDVDAKQT